MVAYAYLRVSTDHQDLDNQRHGILEYANHHGISSIHFVEEPTSSRNTNEIYLKSPPNRNGMRKKNEN